MAANEIVQARIAGDIKDEAAAVLESMGLTLSDAVRVLLTRIAREHTLPFEMLVPNETTVKAMKAARRGETKKVRNVHALLTDLDADD